MAAINDCNGIKTKLEIERRDWLKLIVAVITILGAAFVVLLFVFQTKADAAAEYAAIEQTAALHAQEVKIRQEYEEKEATQIKKDVEDTKKILRTLDINQRTLMKHRGIGERRVAPLPAGISFDDGP